MTIYNLAELVMMAKSQRSLRIYLAALTVAIARDKERKYAPIGMSA